MAGSHNPFNALFTNPLQNHMGMAAYFSEGMASAAAT
jgi:hypothetical protein